MFCRVCQNKNGWERPSLKLPEPSRSEGFVFENGFGHEEWNFDLESAVNGWMHGYHYHQQGIRHYKEPFNICFAEYKMGDSWYIAGFYMNAEFHEKGAKFTQTTLERRAKHLADLQKAGALRGHCKEQTLPFMAERLRKGAKFHRWRVRVADIIVPSQPVRIQAEILAPKSAHDKQAKYITEEWFHELLKLCIQEAAQDEIPNYDQDCEEFPEGSELYRLHKEREGSRILVSRAKGYIEAHHTIPVNQLAKGHVTRIEDIAMVCSNCHRMLHRRRPWLSIEKLTSLVARGPTRKQNNR